MRIISSGDKVTQAMLLDWTTIRSSNLANDIPQKNHISHKS